MMTNESAVLKKILSELPDQDVNISEEEYQAWKVHFESKSEHEKVFNLLGVLSQYLLGGGRAGASILAHAVVCTNRWCTEKDNEEFIRSM